ncbi:ataxin-8-like isoform X2 [Microplitis demolitor]|uniref:ataxin-8-like isoform X2 n=1 Tax=Microplitis demolitor TaxID=69319 RepID=UPI0006D5096E|nr:ataxin-8-like isoform X2 [Microplitis demolitor]XP_053594256.1 ataxin-8-like isoform X2 [Microplitis demolitor]
MDDSNEAVARNENNVEMISEGEDSDLSENIYNNELKLTPEISKSSNTNAVKKQLMKARQRNMKVRLFEPKQQQQEQELQRQQQQQELGQQQLELQGLQQQELGQQQLELQGLQQPELQGLQQLELQGLQQQQRQRLQAHNAGCY